MPVCDVPNLPSETVAAPARVIRGVGGLYSLFTEGREILMAKPRGIFRKDGRQILPGDFVNYAPSGDVDIPWRIETLLPRKNRLIRPPLANLDFLFIVLAHDQPAPDFLLLDKLIAYAAACQIAVAIIWSKLDLLEALDAPSQARIEAEKDAYRNAGFEQFDYAPGPTALASLKAWIAARLSGLSWAVAGQSGVGKSSLCNALLGEAYMEVGNLSERLGRGRHTTRHVELLPFAGGFMVDTPGFTSLEVSALELGAQDLWASYPDFAQLACACRYPDCKHLSEPACEVKSYIEKRPEQRGRYERYVILRKQVDEAETLRKEGKR